MMSALAEQIRAAIASRAPVRIAAGQTWLGAGRPVVSRQILSLSGDRGITEYVPGDLTLTARAGTPISDLVAATKANDQWLPLDPWGGDDGTIGATVSTATAGPHAHSMGLPRDVVLGLEYITGAGETVRAGGRVVKNVAGFDLTRLMIGSWGTLGVITEVTVRLRARPLEMRTLALAVPPTANALNELAIRLRALPFTPLAAELTHPGLASELGAGSLTTLLLRIGGNAHAVRGQLDLLRQLGALSDVPATVWGQLRCADASSRFPASWRWSALPSQFGDTWSAALKATDGLEDAIVHGSPMRGIVRIAAKAPPDALARAALGFAGTRAVEKLPDAAWPQVPEPADHLASQLRARFDPGGVLNPGILGTA